jgi:hypothetical protein
MELRTPKEIFKVIESITNPFGKDLLLNLEIY